MPFKNLFIRLIRARRNFSYTRNETIQTNSAESYRPTLQDLLRIKERLERVLTENIIPFWYSKVIDLEYGGYRLNHDIRGRWNGIANKHLVTQARTVWFFSRLANTEYGTNKHLEAARHGYEFLCDRMWDKQFGGFYWEVDSSGSRVSKPCKHMYGQAFGLYALSQYAVASGDSRATALAQKLFSLMDNYAHDSEHGGYVEFFSSDWSLVPLNTIGYMNVAANIKLMNTHLHLMEAITAYFLVSKDPLARERLIELIFVQSNAVVRKAVGACTDKYQSNWVPLKGPDCNSVSYGHILENVWMLIEACNVAGIPNFPLLDLCQALFGYSLQYGFDQRSGGFYYIGQLHKSADRREKIWWVQAEGLVSALQMYRLTGEEIYFDCFSRTLDWVVKHQVDWEYGDWYAQLAENGKPSGDKAGAWKSPYHNGRAMVQCLELLKPFIES